MFRTQSIIVEDNRDNVSETISDLEWEEASWEVQSDYGLEPIHQEGKFHLI